MGAKYAECISSDILLFYYHGKWGCSGINCRHCVNSPILLFPPPHWCSCTKSKSYQVVYPVGLGRDQDISEVNDLKYTSVLLHLCRPHTLQWFSSDFVSTSLRRERGWEERIKDLVSTIIHPWIICSKTQSNSELRSFLYSSIISIWEVCLCTMTLLHLVIQLFRLCYGTCKVVPNNVQKADRALELWNLVTLHKLALMEQFWIISHKHALH